MNSQLCDTTPHLLQHHPSIHPIVGFKSNNYLSYDVIRYGVLSALREIAAPRCWYSNHDVDEVWYSTESDIRPISWLRVGRAVMEF